jgi:hypothetical protein
VPSCATAFRLHFVTVNRLVRFGLCAVWVAKLGFVLSTHVSHAIGFFNTGAFWQMPEVTGGVSACYGGTPNLNFPVAMSGYSSSSAGANVLAYALDGTTLYMDGDCD